MSLDLFSPAVREWFDASFESPTPAQVQGWPAIASGGHTLILAPTGSGKTLAAFLWALDRLGGEPTPPPAERCRVLYVSPLRALAVDVEKNLRAPLAGIRLAAERLRIELHEPTVAMRTGDTSANDRRTIQKRPPDILITTPESLYLMLTSQAREVLRSVRWVIVDEVHSVAATKRGAHLALSLERLEAVTRVSPQRIGLSATQRPLEEIARFLGGRTDDGPRPVTIVDAGHRKPMEIEVVVPVEDMAELGQVPERGKPGPAPVDQDRLSIWPSVHPRLLELIRGHRSTLIFVNARRLAERLAASLNELAGEDLVRAHHGSIAREQRLEIEDRLKRERFGDWWPRARWSSGSTWGPSTWWCRWSRRARWPGGSNGSAGPATASASPAGESCSPSTAATSWRPRSWSTGCWTASSRRPGIRGIPSTS